MADILGWIVSSKTVCSSPSPQYLRMWPYLEIAICTYIQVKLRSHWIGVDLRRRGRSGHRDTQGHREHHVEMEMMLEWCLYKPRTPNIRATPRSGRAVPRKPPEEPAVPTPWFWTPSLQDHGSMGFCCPKPPSRWHFVPAALGSQYSW